MDYIYGKLNKEVEQKLYKGGVTDSAVVDVDNSTGTIYVSTQSSKVDDALSEESTNAVQNKVVSEKFAEVSKDFETKNNQIVHKLFDYDTKLRQIIDRVTLLSNNIIDVSNDTTAQVYAVSDKLDIAIQDLDNYINRDEFNESINIIENNISNVRDLSTSNAETIVTLKNNSKDVNTKIQGINKRVTDEENARKSDIQDIRLEIDALRGTVSSSTQYDELYDIVDNTEIKLTKLQDQVNAQKSELVLADKAISDDVTNLSNRVNKQLDAQTAAVTSLLNETKALEDNISQNSDEISNVKNSIDDISSALVLKDTSIHNIQSELSVISEKSLQQDNRINSLDKAIKDEAINRTNDVAKIHNDISDAFDSIVDVKNDIEPIKTDLSVLVNRLLKSESAVYDISKNITNQESEINSVKSDLLRVEAYVEKESEIRSKEIEGLKSQIKDLNFDAEQIPEFQSLKDTVDNHTFEIEIIQSSIDYNLPKIKDQQEKLSNQIDKLSSRIAEEQKTHDSDISVIENELEKLHDELRDINDSIEGVSEDTLSLFSSVTSLTATVSKLQSDIKKVRSDFTASDRILQDALTSLKNKDIAYNTRISALENKIALVTDNSYDAKISEINEDIADLSTQLNNETSRRQIEDTKLRELITNVDSKINNETEKLEVQLQTAVTNQGNINSRLQSNISSNKSYIDTQLVTVYSNISTILEDVEEISTKYESLVKDVKQIVSAVESNSKVVTEVEDRVQVIEQYIPTAFANVNSTIESATSELFNKVFNIEQSLGEVDLNEDGPLSEQVNHLHGHLVVVQSQLADIQESILDEVREAIDTVAFEGVYVLKNYPLEENKTTVYASRKTGDLSIDVGVESKPDFIVQRNAEGNIELNGISNFEETNAVHKRYVDSTVKTTVDNLEAFIMSLLAEKFSIIDGGTTADL